LNPGDTFSALVPGDDITKPGIILDAAGHIDNIKLVTYKLPDAANF